VMAAEPKPTAEQPEESAVVWEPCSGCWGQREQWAQGDEGGWWKRTCPTCGGIGEVMRERKERR